MTDIDRPKILLINPIVPYPPNQGTKVATLGLIKALGHDFDVTVLARVASDADVADAKQLGDWCDRVVTVMAPNRKSIFHRVYYKIYFYLLSSLFRRSIKGLYDCPGALVRAARRLAKEDFDLVIIGYWQLGKMLDVFPKERCVLLTHDIDMLVNRKISLLERNLVKKVQAVRRWILEQKEELSAYRTAKHVWALTERDKAAVEAVSRNNCDVEVLPLGVDVDYFAPSGMQRTEGEVLFLGYLGALFNRDALEYFIRKIYPHMDDVEGLSITVVGGDLPDEVEHFGLQPEVEVVGRVADVRPYLHRAACIVIPLRFGGGLRLRVLEAMAAGLPIVCSAVAIAGMPFEPEKEYLLADTPEEFASQIRKVLADPDLAARISKAASRKVMELYSLGPQERGIRALATCLIESAK